jgi:hypothetical protein
MFDMLKKTVELISSLFKKPEVKKGKTASELSQKRTAEYHRYASEEEYLDALRDEVKRSKTVLDRSQEKAEEYHRYESEEDYLDALRDELRADLENARIEEDPEARQRILDTLIGDSDEDLDEVTSPQNNRPRVDVNLEKIRHPKTHIKDNSRTM